MGEPTDATEQPTQWPLEAVAHRPASDTGQQEQMGATPDSSEPENESCHA